MNFQTKHGGVLIAIKNNIRHEEVTIIDNFELIATKLYTTPKPTLICAVHNLPELSPYKWEIDYFTTSPYYTKSLLHENSKLNIDAKYQKILIAGDINFSKTNWSQMTGAK